LNTAAALLLLLSDRDDVIFGPNGLIEATSGGDRATKKTASMRSVRPIRTDRQTDRICSASVTKSAVIAAECGSQNMTTEKIITLSSKTAIPMPLAAPEPASPMK